MINNLYNVLINDSTPTGWESVPYYILDKKKVLGT